MPAPAAPRPHLLANMLAPLLAMVLMLALLPACSPPQTAEEEAAAAQAPVDSADRAAAWWAGAELARRQCACLSLGGAVQARCNAEANDLAAELDLHYGRGNPQALNQAAYQGHQAVTDTCQAWQASPEGRAESFARLVCHCHSLPQGPAKTACQDTMSRRAKALHDHFANLPVRAQQAAQRRRDKLLKACGAPVPSL